MNCNKLCHDPRCYDDSEHLCHNPNCKTDQHIKQIEAEVERLNQQNAELRAEVREWLCSKCNTVYPGPPTSGLDCVVCPKCGGITAPRQTVRISQLQADVAQLTAQLTGETNAIRLIGERNKALDESAQLNADLQFSRIEAQHQKDNLVAREAEVERLKAELAEERSRLDWILENCVVRDGRPNRYHYFLGREDIDAARKSQKLVAEPSERAGSIREVT